MNSSLPREPAQTAASAPPAAVPASVIIPARNAATTIARTLQALQTLPADWELLVVDDHSSDDTAAVVRRHGVRLLPSHGVRSDYAARNTGAAAARGSWLVFVDADIEIAAPALVAALQRAIASGAPATFGIYDQGAHLGRTVERYKNFWIRHTTLSAPRPLTWLNTSVALVRRDAYDAVGGFRERFHARRGGGDLDFGRRIHDHCGPIQLDPQTTATHHKRLDLRGLISNDFRRARGWMRLALATRAAHQVALRPGLANVRPRFSVGALATGTGLVATIGALFWPPLLALAAAGWVTAPILNFDFLRAAAGARIPGWPWFLPLLWVDALACCAGIAVESAAQAIQLGRRLAGADD